MNNPSHKLSINDMPLWIDRADIFRIYLDCLNFIKDDIFEIVPAKKKIPQRISAEQLITERVSPRLSGKSKYGVCLHPLKKTGSTKECVERWVLFSPNVSFKDIANRLKIITSEDEAGSFHLVPSIDMYLVEYKLYIEHFIETFCRRG